MAVKPTPPGTAYRTNKDLQSLFASFPRADDGSQAELPDKIADTIVPTINLADPVTIAINSLALERLQIAAAAPAQQTGSLITPANERWMVWRVVVGHSDGMNHSLTALLQQPGVGGAALAIDNTVSMASAEQWSPARALPLIMQPLASMVGWNPTVLAVGSISLDLLITRFNLTDTLPQVTIGF